MGRVASPRPMGPGEVLAVYQNGPLDGQSEIIELQHGVPPVERRITDSMEPVTAVIGPAELDRIPFPKIGIYRTTGGGSWYATGAGLRKWVEAIYVWRGWDE